jgi:hypothetical protein
MFNHAVVEYANQCRNPDKAIPIINLELHYQIFKNYIGIDGIINPNLLR